MQPVKVRHTGTPRSPEETARLVELLAIRLGRFLGPAERGEPLTVDFLAELSVHSDDQESRTSGAPNL